MLAEVGGEALSCFPPQKRARSNTHATHRHCLQGSLHHAHDQLVKSHTTIVVGTRGAGVGSGSCHVGALLLAAHLERKACRPLLRTRRRRRRRSMSDGNPPHA
jgi:hypothetical protein